MPWAVAGAGISAAASIGGSILGGNAQQKAAKQAAAAQQQQLDYSKGIYDTAQTNLNPYIDTGQNALYSLASLYGLPVPGGAPGGGGNGASQAFTNFTNTPQYQFAQQQGLLGASRGVNATGVGGPAVGKALAQYSSGLASQGFNSYIGQLASLAGLGQTSASNLAGIGNGAAGSQAQLASGSGSALASGTIGASNSLNQGIGGALSAFGQPNNGNPSGTSFGPSSAFGQAASGASNWISNLFNNGNAGGGVQQGNTFYASPAPEGI
jgi:hypothetical protein